MAVYGEGGVLWSLQVPLGWGCGRTSEKVGKRFCIILSFQTLFEHVIPEWDASHKSVISR